MKNNPQIVYIPHPCNSHMAIELIVHGFSYDMDDIEINIISKEEQKQRQKFVVADKLLNLIELLTDNIQELVSVSISSFSCQYCGTQIGNNHRNDCVLILRDKIREILIEYKEFNNAN